MTKLKSKKMSKSTFAVIIMAILMVAMLAFGGTYAYFTSQPFTKLEDSVNAGTIKLTTTAGADIFATETTLRSYVLPGEDLIVLEEGKTASNLVITDESNRASYIFFEYSIEVYPVAETYNEEKGTELAKADDSVYTKDAVTVTGLTANMSNALTVSNTAASVSAVDSTKYPTIYVVKTVEEDDDQTADINEKTVGTTYTLALGTNGSVTLPDSMGNEFQGALIKIVIAVESIQAHGFDTALEAWEYLHPVEDQD